MITAFLYCSLPNVLVYPFKFDTGGNGIISSEFFLRLGGYLLGIIICALSGFGVYKLYMCSALKGIRAVPFAAMCTGLVLYGVYFFGKLMAVLTTRKIIDDLDLFNFAAQSNNLSHWYTYGLFILALVVGIIFFIKSFTKKEPFSTKAQQRKQRALWRSGKRYSLVLIACFIAGILCSTLFVEMNKVVIREAPVEEPVIIKDAGGEDKELQVPLEMVSDGHLHRFGYKTAEGSHVRFIVVLKQENTSNYGIGLDACEICGKELDYNGIEHYLISPSNIQYLRKKDDYTEVLILRQGLHPYVTELPDYSLIDLFIDEKEEKLIDIKESSSPVVISFDKWVDGIVEGRYKLPFPAA